MNLALRPYQTESFGAIRDAYRHGARRPLLVSPTGSGKTVVFAYITERAAARGRRVLILTHRKEIRRQVSNSLRIFNVTHGLIAPGQAMTGDRVQVASVQTIVKRLDKLPSPDLIIIDECHHATATSWRRILDKWPDALLLGVTATPCRLDGKALGIANGGYFDAMIQGPTVRELIDGGYLSDPVVYAPPNRIALDTVTVRAGDYATDEIAELVDRPVITGNAIDHYMRFSAGLPCIVFCTTVDHAANVSAAFNERGITAQSIDGKLPPAQRDNRIEALATGRIHVLTSCEIISEGTDIPVVTTAILLRPTHSMGLYLQQVGRCLRPHPNKTHSVVLDHVGNAIRHGLPDETRRWSLTVNTQVERAKQNQEQNIYYRQCPKCFYCHMARPSCPQCGYVYEAKDRTPEEVAGELVRLEAARVQEIREQKRAARKEQGQSDDLESLIQLGISRGYNEYNAKAWAQHVVAGRQTKRERKVA